MRRTIWFFVVLGLICGGGVVCWRLRRRRRSVGRSPVTPVMALRPRKAVEEAYSGLRSPAPSRNALDCWVQSLAS